MCKGVCIKKFPLLHYYFCEFVVFTIKNGLTSLQENNVHCPAMPVSVADPRKPGEEDGKSADVVRGEVSSHGACDELHEWPGHDDRHR